LTLSAKDITGFIGGIADFSEDALEILNAFHLLHKALSGKISSAPLQAFHHGLDKSEAGIEKDTPSFALCRILVESLFVLEHQRGLGIGKVMARAVPTMRMA